MWLESFSNPFSHMVNLDLVLTWLNVIVVESHQAAFAGIKGPCANLGSKTIDFPFKVKDHMYSE